MTAFASLMFFIYNRYIANVDPTTQRVATTICQQGGTHTASPTKTNSTWVIWRKHRAGKRWQFRRSPTLRQSRKAVPHVLGAVSLPSQPGNERTAAQIVLHHIASLSLTSEKQNCIYTAVAEGVMNAIEHGNHNHTWLFVHICTFTVRNRLVITIADQGGHQPFQAPVKPILEEKLAGRQPSRGWGMFLIEKMTDQLMVFQCEGQHILALIFHQAA